MLSWLHIGGGTDSGGRRKPGRCRGWLVLLLATLTWPACTPLRDTTTHTVVPAQPADFPQQRYQAGYGPQGTVYQVDSDQSVIKALVYRAGRLARAGIGGV